MVAHNCSPVTQEAEARNPQLGGRAGLQSVPVSKNRDLSFSYLSQTAWNPATRLGHVTEWFEILTAHENYLWGLILKQPFLNLCLTPLLVTGAWASVFLCPQ